MLAKLDFELVASRASARYLSSGKFAAGFARGKLLKDPVYRAIWDGGFLSKDQPLLDLGCGGGLVLALVAAARELSAKESPVAPLNRRLLFGVETRKNVASVARRALNGHAQILTGDARVQPLPRAQTILLLDVLHMMPEADQDSLLKAVQEALEPRGTVLVRETDANAGWRFQAVKFANRFKAVVKGYSSSGFHFRRSQDWHAWLQRAGFEVELRPMGRGTPFGNVLFIARAPIRGRT